MNHSLRLALVFAVTLESAACFGGDFNGDGFDDLAIGVPDADPAGLHDSGRVQVVFGSATGLDASTVEHLSDFALAFPGHASANFGAALAHGDFDGDGFDDLAIGAPGTPVNGLSGAGVVYVVPGSAAGMNTAALTLWSQNTPGIKDKVEANAFYIAAAAEYFGSVLAVGDFDGDGFDDLAIAVLETIKKNAAYAGAVHVLFGSTTGLRAKRNQFWHLDSKGVPGKGTAGATFGEALAAGDFDGDGFDDLAASSHAQFDTDTWEAILVLRGGKKGLVTKGRKWFAPDGSGTVDNNYGSTGNVLAVGDLDGDGFEDLALGYPGLESFGSNGAGAVRLFPGSIHGLNVGAISAVSRGQFGVEGALETYLGFGTAVAIGDSDADGRADLFVGVPGATVGVENGAGEMQVFRGKIVDLISVTDDAIWSKDSSSVVDVAAATDGFARTLATGDYDGDGFADVVVGVPMEAIGADAQAGAIHVLYGSPSGVTATGDQYFTLTSFGITPKKWDHFAAALN